MPFKIQSVDFVFRTKQFLFSWTNFILQSRKHAAFMSLLRGEVSGNRRYGDGECEVDR